MSIRKIPNSKSIPEYLKKYLDDKNALHDAIMDGRDIEKIAKERGLKLVKPI